MLLLRVCEALNPHIDLLWPHSECVSAGVCEDSHTTHFYTQSVWGWYFWLWVQEFNEQLCLWPTTVKWVIIIKSIKGIKVLCFLCEDTLFHRRCRFDVTTLHIVFFPWKSADDPQPHTGESTRVVLQCVVLQCCTYAALRYNRLHYIRLRYVTLHYVRLCYVVLCLVRLR